VTGPRLGAAFSRLLAAVTVTNLGDGVRLAAGPLLIASQTRTPVLVGAAVFIQQVPWLVGSLPAGAWVDRLDRRRVLVAVTLLRAVLAGVLVGAIAADWLTVPLIYAVLLLVGTAEVIADNAAGALLPAVVADPQLPRANARLSAAFTVGNQLAGPPLGAALFAVGVVWPFGVEAATFVLAGLLVNGLPAVPAAAAAARDRGWLRRDIAEGVRWLWSHPPVRLLAVVLAVMNVTFAAAFATWVLYARVRLGLSAGGFGLLLTASAVGALAGAALAGWLTDRFGPAALLRAGLTIETVVHLVLALTRSPWVAGSAMVAFGVHAAVWGVVAATVRQRLVPDRLRGRVGSVYYLLVMGGSALGALVGGALAGPLGLTGPFWVAVASNVVLGAFVWRRFPEIERGHGSALA
jgi:MFS family permease